MVTKLSKTVDKTLHSDDTGISMSSCGRDLPEYVISRLKNARIQALVVYPLQKASYRQKFHH